MLQLTVEQSHEISDDKPVQVFVPGRQRAFFLITEEMFESVRELLAIDKSRRSLFDFRELPDER